MTGQTRVGYDDISKCRLKTGIRAIPRLYVMEIDNDLPSRNPTGKGIA